MNIKLKLLLFSILISVSSLSFAVDTDGDGVDDSIDNCPFIANSDQANFDEDSFGDNCDFDDDNDRVVDQKDPDPHNPTIIHSSSVYESEYNDEREFSTLFNYIAEGYLSDINDVDWFKVDVNESGTTGSFSVAFDTRLISQSNKFFDVDWFGPDMSIRSGRNISSDDNLFLYTFPAFETGSYFVRVQYSMGASYFYSGGRYRIIAKAESFVTTAEICDGMDINNDGVFDSDVCDSDGDSIADVVDAYPFNSLYSADSDSDGMPDAWETRYGLNPNDASDASSDQDNDGVSAIDEFLAGTIPSGSLDIDGNEKYDALTDGLLLLRGMFGLDGSALITGTVASDATYTESVDIESRIATLGDLADIDGNGEIDALTDGLLTLRYLFGLQGDTLINGVVAVDATRKTAEEIEAHLETLMPSL